MLQHKPLSLFFTFILVGLAAISPSQLYAIQWEVLVADSTTNDSLVRRSGKRPIFNQKDNRTLRFTNRGLISPFVLPIPKNIQPKFKLDSDKRLSIFEQIKVTNTNSLDYRIPQTLPLNKYNILQNGLSNKKIWSNYALKSDNKSDVSGRSLIPKIQLGDGLDRIFGGNGIEFKPTGYVLLDMGLQFTTNNASNIPISQQKTGNFIFNEQININFTGRIGGEAGNNSSQNSGNESTNTTTGKSGGDTNRPANPSTGKGGLAINANFDTKAAFNFQNKMMLNYKTSEEDIIQKIELGNTSFQSPSLLIPSVQNLFGINTLLRFGRLDVNIVASQQRSKQECFTVKGGVNSKGFEVRVDQYDENRHFFLSQFFRNNYERSLRNLPMVTSNVSITRIEVYVTNRSNNTETLRNILGVTNIGENQPYNQPADNANNVLYKNITQNSNVRQVDKTSLEMESAYAFVKGQDYELLRGAKRLTDREYRFQAELGYISLNTPLRNDEVLAVSYEYTLNGRKYKVGELTEDYQSRKDDEVLVLKLLKSSTLRNNVSSPMWNLMMKNVYSLNAPNIAKQGFQLRIIYKDDLTGIDNPSLQEGSRLKDVPLLQVLNLDKLNSQLDAQPDGNFDFIENVTINSKDGKIIFPVLEPFGSNLRKNFDANELILAEKYVFDDLYRTTLADAQQKTDKNKFFLKGSFQSSAGAELQLPFGVDSKSVTVTAGGVNLQQGSDFIADSQSGKVRITNTSIANSGRDIRVCYERPDMFSNQVKTLLAGRFDYALSPDVRLGATVMQYKETPPANLRRVGIGNEPANNTMIGFDANIKKDSRAISRFLDRLPLIETKEASSFTFQGEFAKLFAGVSDRVNGRSYIDDFESARNVYDLTRQPKLWRMGATPLGFSEQTNNNPLGYAYKRAKMSVYSIDNTFYGQGGVFGNLRPDNISDTDLQNQYEKQVLPQTIFVNKQNANGFVIPLGVLDLSYFPAERGMYNYTTDLNLDGTLKNARKNFGAVTRNITSDIDFDNANVETLEFWLLNPFIDGTNGVVRATGTSKDKNNTTGGKLLFHLGDISEDVIPDGRYNYENGLPIHERISQGSNRNVDSTAWGFAPKAQFITQAFSNQPNARPKQDIGLDGMSNADEKLINTNYLQTIRPKLSIEAYNAIEADPGADDFQFYFTEKATAENQKIIQRYKNFLGTENNTPENSPAGEITPAGTNLPDVEDLNIDNTINDIDAYYEYEIDLRKGGIEVGKGYVVDKVSTADGADWYLFRVPIRSPTSKKGNINGFKSIRFMRMMMTDFQEPVVMRFAQLQLTGYQYRKYLGDLTKTGLSEVPEPYDAQFKVSTVSIEENGPGNRGANATNIVPYVLPPGYVRDNDLTTLNNIQLNEQSMSLCVSNLRDGDSRAVFKNISNLDLINYERLNMVVHMENKDNESDKVSSFIRLGTDLTQNYYEIEIKSLKATNPSSVSQTAPEPEKVWPIENEFNISLNELKAVKSTRNSLGAAYTKPFSLESEDKKYTITVVGVPDLSSVQTIMLGVRNPKDDGKDKSFCVWLNELHTEGFNQASGMAAIGKMNMKLADFANITANGGIKTFGFGSVQSKIAERAREQTLEYGFTANVNLEKLGLEKVGLKIPMYVTYDRRNIKPNFNPLDADTPLEQTLANIPATETRENYQKANYQNLVQDNTERRSINFSNVRKAKTKPDAKKHLYDVENLAVTYAYSENTRTNTVIQEYRAEQHKAAIAYAYQPDPKIWEPFRGSTAVERPFLYFLKDINFNFVPSSIQVRTDMDRSFIKNQFRNSELTTAGVQPTFEKYWLFNRIYDLNWNFTKSIVLTYSATANAIIDEPRGEIDNQIKRDSVWRNIGRFGRTKFYTQQISAVYRLPLDKFKLTDWISADYSYRAGYSYAGNSIGIADSLNVPFGNILKNNRDQSIRGKIDFVRLYNKVKSLKWANTPNPASKRVGLNPGAMEDIIREQDGITKTFLRALMTVRGIQFSYDIQESTTLPGFLPKVGLLGLASANNNAPGMPFAFGSQNGDIRFEAARNGWLSKSTEANTPFVQNIKKKFTLSTRLEPFKGFNVTIDAKLDREDNYSETFKPLTPNGEFQSLTPLRGGNFSMSFLSFATSFATINDDYTSPIFDRFKSYRNIIAQRLKVENTANGTYNSTSQDVLIPAFFAAYSGRDPNTVSFSPFYNIPFPNWSIDYNNLTDYEPFKSVFSSFTIRHSFSSTYSVGRFTSSLEYGYGTIGLGAPIYPLGTAINQDNYFIPVYVMSAITISEKFSPLIGINFRTKSNWQGRAEYNQERTVSLILTNAMLSEISNKDLVIGFGVTKANFKIPFRVQGRNIVLKNDLKFNFNLTIRDTKTIIRKLDSEPVVQAGGYIFQISPRLTYDVNRQLTLTMYFDHNLNQPYISNNGINTRTAGGFQVRFNLN